MGSRDLVLKNKVEKKRQRIEREAAFKKKSEEDMLRDQQTVNLELAEPELVLSNPG